MAIALPMCYKSRFNNLLGYITNSLVSKCSPKSRFPFYPTIVGIKIYFIQYTPKNDGLTGSTRIHDLCQCVCVFLGFLPTLNTPQQMSFLTDTDLGPAEPELLANKSVSFTHLAALASIAFFGL